MSRRMRRLKRQRNLLISGSKTKSILEPDLIAIGDSNTEISYFSEVPHKKWTSLIGKNLNMETLNIGKDGRSTFDFLQGGDSIDGSDRLSSLLEYDAKYYIICFGLNDAKYVDTSRFESDTREMINQIQTNTTGTPILMTNVWVDYPEHYSYDRNTSLIKPYDDVKRALADELGLHLIDVYERIKYEHDVNSLWDVRIRTTEVWGDSQDYLHEGDISWWSNIHYNILGNEIVADEIVKYFQANILN